MSLSEEQRPSDGHKTPTNSPAAQNGPVTELKNFIMREAPPPRQNVLLSGSATSLSERETSSSPIV